MTKPTTIALVLALTGLGLAGIETADQKLFAAEKTPMSGAEIQRLWASGVTLRGELETGMEFTVQYFPDGTATIDYFSFNSDGTDKGTWWVEGDKSCKKWENIGSGEKRCTTIYKIGDNKYRSVPERGSTSTWSIIK